MPASWESVASNPQFQALPPDQKVAASKQYFDTVVKPQVPPEHLVDAQQQFAAHAKETIPRSFGESTSARAGEAMAEKPSGLASFVRKKVLGFDPLTPMAKTAGVIAAPLGAAGETLERKAGQAAGANPVKLEKAARDTGDVTSNLLSIMPGAKVAKAGEAIGEGALAAGKSVGKGAETMKGGWNARDAEALDATVAQMEAKSTAAATKMREMGVRFKPEVTQKLAEHIDTELKGFGKQDASLHGGTMKVLDDMRTASKKGFDMEELDIFRKRLRQEANLGGENGKLAVEAMDAIRVAAESFKKSLPPGASFAPYVDQWAQARRFDTLADIVKQAGGNPQKIKAGFDKLLKNEKKIRGFNADERAAIKEAAEYTTPEKLMRLAGKFGFELGDTKTPAAAVLPGMEVLYGGAYHNPYMLPLVVGGTAARAGGKYLARGKAENALNVTARRGATANEALGAETDPLAKRTGQ
jgi:hypothetical protein